MNEQDTLKASNLWREMNVSLEGGNEFAPFWVYGEAQRSSKEATYVLHPQCTIRWEPHWFPYGIVYSALGNRQGFCSEEEVKIGLAIKQRPLTIAQIAEELNMQSPEEIAVIEKFVNALVRNSLALTGNRRELSFLSNHDSDPVDNFADLAAFKAPFPSAPLNTAVYLTYDCNVNCIHCGVNRQTHQKSLSGDEWIKVFEKLRKAGVYSLVLNGGEPLAHPDANQILRYLAKSPFYVRLYTNGALIDDEKIDILTKASNFFLSISMDGATAEVHDDFRRKKGTFDRVMRAVEGLRKGNPDLPCLFACVIHKNNMNNLEDVMKLAIEKNMTGLMFISFNYTEYLAKSDYYVSVQQHPEILANLRQTAEKYQDRLLITVQGRGPKLKPVERAIPEYFGHKFVCNSGIIDWTINPVGDVYPCETVLTLSEDKQKQFYIGNIVTQKISDIWNSKGFALFRGEYTEQNLKECPECSHYDKCGAKKCRLYALTSNGDYDGPAFECQFKDCVTDF